MTVPTPASGATVCVACGSTVPAGSGICPQCGTPQVRPASIAARLAAVTVDVAAVAIVASVVVLLTHSIVLALAALAEAAILLWILQARTGATLGNALMRLRAARMDQPYSPGAGRALLRGTFTAVGLCVLAVGAWLLELTGLADRSGWRRSWADRASGTVVVEVPRTARAAPAAQGALVPARPAPFAAPPAPPALAGQAPAPILSSASVEPPAAQTGGPGPRHSRSAAVLAELPAPRRASPPAAPPAGAPSLPATSAPTMLLIFDSGQRELVPVPCAIVLGRNPAVVQDGDLLIIVEDPDRSVSKGHARLEITQDGAWVTDLGSTNGTDLLTEDGAARTVGAQQRTRVEDGTRVRVGDRTITMSRLAGADS